MGTVFARAATLLLAAALLWFPSAASTQELRLGWSAVSALNAPFWVMKEAGFLAQEKLDAELIYIPSSSTMAQAQVAGDVHISTANSQVIVDADLRGSDLVAIGAISNTVAFYIMADPKIAKVTDLRGKRVGVTRFGASTDFAIRTLLERHGLKPISEVPIVQIGGMPEIAAALSNGAIAAAPMSYPMAYVAEQKGMKLLSNLAKENIPFVHVGITTTRGFLERNRSQTMAVLRAYGRAVHYMHTNPEGFKKIITRYSKIVDPGMLEGSVRYAHDFVERVPLVKPEAFQFTINEIAERRPAAKQAKPEQFFDNRLVQELIGEGFFRSLWGKDLPAQARSTR
jgi:NitT/TauT family transport system substrate-binding protein